MPGPPVSGRSIERFLWLLGRESGLEDCGGSKVVVAESTDAVLWGSGGPRKGESGVGREAARPSLHRRQSRGEVLDPRLYGTLMNLVISVYTLHLTLLRHEVY